MKLKIWKTINILYDCPPTLGLTVSSQLNTCLNVLQPMQWYSQCYTHAYTRHEGDNECILTQTGALLVCK